LFMVGVTGIWNAISIHAYQRITRFITNMYWDCLRNVRTLLLIKNSQRIGIS
ncbi:hypothetical protein MKW92_022604, partial [Papaver armeniacum]